MDAKAVVFTDRLKVAFQEVTVPEPGPNDVVVDTRYSWISNGTEGSFLRCERVNGETPYQPGDPWPFPIAPGYQSTGIVTHVGESVTDITVGEWVFATIGRIDGMYEPAGGHISPKVMDRSQVWRLPEKLSPVAASGLVLTQVGYNCGARPPIGGDCVALVIGDGLVGHWAAQTLRWRGASVILAGRHDDRLAHFSPNAQKHTINTRGNDLIAVIKELIPPGINILVDTVGSVETIMACHKLMRHNGHIVSAGFHTGDSHIDIQKLRFGELTLHAPSGWDHQRMCDTLALIAAGNLDTEGLITHRFPVERAADAWRLILEKTEPVLGVVLEWPGNATS